MNVLLRELAHALNAVGYWLCPFKEMDAWDRPHGRRLSWDLRFGLSEACWRLMGRCTELANVRERQAWGGAAWVGRGVPGRFDVALAQAQVAWSFDFDADLPDLDLSF